MTVTYLKHAVKTAATMDDDTGATVAGMLAEIEAGGDAGLRGQARRLAGRHRGWRG